MKSVYLRILVWFFSTLLISMLAFIMVSSFITYRSEGVRPIGPALDAILFEEAIRAYESGGPGELVKRMEQLHKYIPGDRYLTSADGHDLATGEDRSRARLLFGL